MLRYIRLLRVISLAGRPGFTKEPGFSRSILALDLRFPDWRRTPMARRLIVTCLRGLTQEAYPRFEDGLRKLFDSIDPQWRTSPAIAALVSKQAATWKPQDYIAGEYARVPDLLSFIASQEAVDGLCTGYRQLRKAVQTDFLKRTIRFRDVSDSGLETLALVMACIAATRSRSAEELVVQAAGESLGENHASAALQKLVDACLQAVRACGTGSSVSHLAKWIPLYPYRHGVLLSVAVEVVERTGGSSTAPELTALRDALLLLSDSQDPELASACARTVAKLYLDAQPELVLRFAKHRNSRIRAVAALHLGRIAVPHPEFRGIAEDLVQDPEEGVRLEAIASWNWPISSQLAEQAYHLASAVQWAQLLDRCISALSRCRPGWQREPYAVQDAGPLLRELLASSDKHDRAAKQIWLVQLP